MHTTMSPLTAMSVHTGPSAAAAAAPPIALVTSPAAAVVAVAAAAAAAMSGINGSNSAVSPSGSASPYGGVLSDECPAPEMMICSEPATTSLDFPVAPAASLTLLVAAQQQIQQELHNQQQQHHHNHHNHHQAISMAFHAAACSAPKDPAISTSSSSTTTTTTTSTITKTVIATGHSSQTVGSDTSAADAVRDEQVSTIICTSYTSFSPSSVSELPAIAIIEGSFDGVLPVAQQAPLHVGMGGVAAAAAGGAGAVLVCEHEHLLHQQSGEADMEAEMAALQDAIGAYSPCALRGILLVSPRSESSLDLDSGSVCSSAPRSKRVSFKADCALENVRVEECWCEELAKERREGSIWLEAARDRDRFLRRIEGVKDVISSSFQRKAEVREHFAARTIQAAFRGYRCRQHGSLAWLNRNRAVAEEERQKKSKAASAKSRDEGISYAEWQKNPFQLPSCPPKSGPQACDGKRRQRRQSDTDGRSSPRPEAKGQKKRGSRKGRTSSSDEGDRD